MVNTPDFHHKLLQVNRVCARRPCWRTKTIEDICIKIEYISQRKIIVLFRSSNMAVVHTLYTLLVTVYLLRFVYIYVSQIKHFKAWIVCVASVSVLFPSKNRAKNGPSPLFHFLALVLFLARPKLRISFLGLSLLRNSTETLATQAKAWIKDHLSKEARFIKMQLKQNLAYKEV